MVEVGDDAKKLGGLAQAAGDDQGARAGRPEGLGQGKQGDDRGFAGLAATVEEDARRPPGAL